MATNRVLLTAALLLTSIPAFPADSDVDFFGSTTTIFESNEPASNNPDGESYTKIKEVLSLNLTWKNLLIGVQGEYIDYSDPELVDTLDLDRLRKTWELRKYYLEYTRDEYSGRLGTFFSSFGHGMTLYVQKNDALRLDEPIRGAMAKASFGRFDVSALGGRVTDPILENQYNRQFDDTLWGARVVANLPFDSYLGASFVGADLESVFSTVTTDEVEMYSFEGGMTSIAGMIDVHAESAEMEYTIGDRIKDGYGRFASTTSYLGPVSITLEFKDYWNFKYRYNLPPSAGRTIENYDHNDVKGGRVLLEGEIFATGTLYFAGYGDFDTHKREGSLGGERGDGHSEWYVGVEQTTDRLYFEGSFFDRAWDVRGIDERHIVADFHYQFGARKEVIFGFDERLEKASFFRLATDRSFAALSWAPWGTLSLRHSWTDSSQTGTERFWGGEIEYHPNTAMTLGIFVGADPGGMVCSGGQCREEPRFDGYKARFAWRF